METENATRSKLTVGVIGARRVRHGIGPFVAAHLSNLGANVAAIAGTSGPSVAAAIDDLRRAVGVVPRGYASVAEMFAKERLDAVAICSPDAAHLEQLKLALDAGVHVLCEKPLIFDGTTNPAEVARPLVDEFAANGLVVAVNEQWPYTLPAFDLVHTGVRQPGVPPRRFHMQLCPGATGAEMIPNSMPHVLSMLSALHGSGTCQDVCVRDIEIHATQRNQRGQIDAASISFAYLSHQTETKQPRQTEARVDLRFMAAPPRPARYAIDGRGVDRIIQEPGYQMFLVPWSPNGADAESTALNSSQSRIPLADPLRLLLADFIKRCDRPAHESNLEAVMSLQALWQVHEAARSHPDFAQILR